MKSRLISVGAVAPLAFAIAGGCAQEPTQTPVRALSSSGPVAFVCLGAGDATSRPQDMAQPLTRCTAGRTGTTDDFSIPHLYALVTQPFSGEVAVVDLTTESNPLVDQDPSVPGANFLPVGASPTDIVATPGSMAAFVAAAEPGFEGIYALPVHLIRGSQPRLSSWPACRLPATPGRVTIAVDPPDPAGRVRPSCDAAHGDADDGVHRHGDLSADADASSKPGRYKLIVAMPGEGGLAVIDAQSILDQEAGAYEPCQIERWLPLEVILPPRPEPPPAQPLGACVDDSPELGPFAAGFAAIPAGFEHDGQRLYVADRGAPVIHRVDLPTPCEPFELTPLLPSSIEDPERVVTTTQVAVSPLTLDYQRYVYAIDDIDGSIMVFDVSDESSETRPLKRARPETNPFQPVDRIRFQAPPRQIVIVQHQNDTADDLTGATLPVRCDPDPTATGPGTKYRTNDAYDAGAGPVRLRGVFAFAVLTTGSIVTIDIDDYDAPCRGPRDEHALFGCQEPIASGIATSGEYTCNAVVPHQSRAAGYLLTIAGIADNQPGIASFPSLFDDEGALIQLGEPGSEGSPRMRATVPDSSPAALTLAVGTSLKALVPDTGLLETDPNEHTLLMNLEDPRAQILDQAWSVTYEGRMPAFSGRFASLSDAALGGTGDGSFVLTDTSARFCDRGVMSQTALEEELTEAGMSPADARERATQLADYVQIMSDSPVEPDAYWSAQTTCTFQQCQQTFGSSLQPRPLRDLRIVEARDGSLDLVPKVPAPQFPTLDCCFPGVVQFDVRPSNQWLAVGDTVGMLHHVTTRQDGVCRNSCDPALALLNSRVLAAPADTEVKDGEPFAFKNPFFRFAINDTPSGEVNVKVTRDMAFRFSTRGAFNPLVLTVVIEDPDVLPTAATFLPNTSELVVSDGILEGITFVDLNALSVTRQYN